MITVRIHTGTKKAKRIASRFGTVIACKLTGDGKRNGGRTSVCTVECNGTAERKLVKAMMRPVTTKVLAYGAACGGPLRGVPRKRGYALGAVDPGEIKPGDLLDDFGTTWRVVKKLTRGPAKFADFKAEAIHRDAFGKVVALPRIVKGYFFEHMNVANDRKPYFSSDWKGGPPDWKGPLRGAKLGHVYTDDESAALDARIAKCEKRLATLSDKQLDRVAEGLVKRHGQSDAALRKRLLENTHPDDLEEALQKVDSSTLFGARRALGAPKQPELGTRTPSRKRLPTGYAIERVVSGFAYARNGNVGRETPKYRWEAFHAGKRIGTAYDERGAVDLVNIHAKDPR